MSDVAPFRSGDLSQSPELSADLEVFKPPLAGFDWAAYEERQARLNEALLSNNPERLSELLHALQAEDPEVGVKLNNMHDTIITGDFAGFIAPLSVMSKTKVDADMPGLDFRGGVAPQASFIGKKFRGANFIDSVLTEADFSGADLRGAEFSNAVLNGANFDGAQLFGVDFSGAYMTGIRGLDAPQGLAGIDLTAVRTVVGGETAEGSLEMVLSSHFGKVEDLETIKRKLDPVPVAIDQTIPRLQTKRILRGLVGRRLQADRVDFTSSQLIGAHLEDFSANGVLFRNAALSGAVILRATMREADFVSAWAPGVIIEDANMRGARLTNANLVGSILRGVDLREVEGLDSKDTNLEGIIIEDCKLPQGYGYSGIAIERTTKQARELER